VTTRLKLVHTSGFRYEDPVAASYNEARMIPAHGRRQAPLDTRIAITPVTWRHAFVDYWGTHVTAFDVLVPHTELTVVSTATVEVFGEPPSSEPAAADWDGMRRDVVRDAFCEYLEQTPYSMPGPEVVELAREAASGLTPATAGAAVCELLGARLAYTPGATSVRTTAAEAWTQGRGVCQDFSHVSLGALRSLGLPARYVSGYLHPDPDAATGEAVTGEGHAWVEWWAGEWLAFDPTHSSPVGTDHVVVARGRDYADVTPLKGIYSGTAASQLFVSVEVTRLQ
jgi:transglutaminase-like putative cysteine protease